MPQHNPVIRSLDLGWGRVKASQNVSFSEKGMSFHPLAFHSIAVPVSTAVIPKDDECLFEKSKTKFVDVGGQMYAVGPDAKDYLQRGLGRVLTDDYIDSDEYMALSKAALAMMHIPDDEIDVLVVGLPVSLWASRRADLEQKMTGVFEVDGRTITVKKALVVRQPHGAFADFVASCDEKRAQQILKNEMTLVVDIGSYTFDWFTMIGNKPAEQFSSAVHNGGVASVLSLLVEQIHQDHLVKFPKLGRDQIENLSYAIDNSVRTGDIVKIGQMPLINQPNHYSPLIRRRADYVVTEMLKKLGSKDSEINNVVITGGGVTYFKEAIEEKFPFHTPYVSKNAPMANCQGYALIGKSWYDANVRG
jgi:plasmid segregation protein ParM